jgi:hypothetical protein
MSSPTKYIDERLDNSITSPTPSTNPVDSVAPLSFTEWLQYNNFLYTNAEEFLTRYQSYLNNWFAVTNTQLEESEKIVREYYTNLINEIVLNFTTVDEKRYLQNLDTSDSREIALAIPFFAKKIKDICLYFSTLRDSAQTANVRYNLKGSNYGISTALYNSFIDSLNVDDLTDNIRTLLLSLSSIRNSLTIEAEDLYDIYPNYFDINPLAPASAYDSNSDLRAQYFNLNQYAVDPDLFLNTGFSVLRAIISYPFYLISLGENLLINPPVRSSDLQFLKDSDYTNLISISSVRALNLSLQAEEIVKYIGADIYYLQTDAVGTPSVSGILCKAESEFANVLNKRFPTVAAVPSEEFLKTGKEIGLFFKPDKLGFANFTNFKFRPVLNYSSLEPDTVYFFPDPKKYGNITSNTNLTFKTPFDFVEDNTFNKVNMSNSFRFGDATTDPYYQTFRAYQSREQSLNSSEFGLARYEDSQGFFTGEKKDIWANRDIYDFTALYRFPLEKRIGELLTLNQTLVQYKTDVYGNEYGMYKLIDKYNAKLITGLADEENEISEDQSTDLTNITKTCLYLDGHLYFDPVSGFNFDYTTVDILKEYSGVILYTAVYPNSFALSGVPYEIKSIVYQPEVFCAEEVTNNYICNIAEGFTFTLVNGQPLGDSPSDSPAYDPLDSALYYARLADAGVNSVNPTYRATFAYQGDFTFMPPSTAVEVYDGLFFLVNGEEPCSLLTRVPPIYVEESNFADVRLANRETVFNASLSTFSTRQPIYSVKNLSYGDLYFRNSNNSQIIPLSSALSAIFIKYNPVVRDEVCNKTIYFDLYYDTLQFETENYLVFEPLAFEYDTNTLTSLNGGVNVIERGFHHEFEKYSTAWFIESEKELLVCKTTLFHDYSASNYKIIFPKIYSFNLNTQQLIQLWPQDKDEALTFASLKMFSLSGKNTEVNIVEIDRPGITYNGESNLYTVTYVGRDYAGAFYIFSLRFQYINGKLTIVDNTMFKLGSDVYNQNFANPDIGTVLETYTILGSAVGSIDPSTGILQWGGYCNTLPCLFDIIENNQSVLFSCGSGSLTVSSQVTGFNIVFGDFTSISMLHNYDTSSFSNCYLSAYNSSSGVTIANPQIFVTNTLSAVTPTTLYTITYSTTGSSILTFISQAITQENINNIENVIEEANTANSINNPNAITYILAAAGTNEFGQLGI